MEAPTTYHGRCVPWQIGTGNRRQICDFEAQPPPHDEMPRWVQEKPPMLQSTCSAPAQQPFLPCEHGQQRPQQPPCMRQQQPCMHQQKPRLQQQQPSLQQQQRLQRIFQDEMLLSDFQRMNGMERIFYVPPEFREKRNAEVKVDAEKVPRRRECRSMCMPKGMGSMDPNCQGEDYRVNSGYQPSRPGDAADRRFDPCCKRKPFRDGTSDGHKANHYQFGKDRRPSGSAAGSAKARDCKTNGCPETETTIGHRSVYPSMGGMIPGYGGHVPGFVRCKFGKTYGRETEEVLRKVKSTEKIANRYSVAEWRTKCFNKEVNC